MIKLLFLPLFYSFFVFINSSNAIAAEDLYAGIQCEVSSLDNLKSVQVKKSDKLVRTGNLREENDYSTIKYQIDFESFEIVFTFADVITLNNPKVMEVYVYWGRDLVQLARYTFDLDESNSSNLFYSKTASISLKDNPNHKLFNIKCSRKIQ